LALPFDVQKEKGKKERGDNLTIFPPFCLFCATPKCVGGRKGGGEKKGKVRILDDFTSSRKEHATHGRQEKKKPFGITVSLLGSTKEGGRKKKKNN